MPGSLLLKITRPVHSRLRAERCRIAMDVMRPTLSMSLLDAGGSPGVGSEFEDLRALFSAVKVVNIDENCTAESRGNVEYEVADGCSLPFPDSSFDWTFSNAVLEHVGDRHKQEKFASEMQRVSRVGYFLSTPNRHFFLDPHTYLPFYHVLPETLQRMAIHLSLGHMRRWEFMRMVSAHELRAIFPEAKVISVGPFGMNLIAFGRRH